jgi:hypothetical protein
MENMANFTLSLTNAEGNPAVEPNCGIEFLRLDDVGLLSARNVQFPPAHTFSLPAYPLAQNIRCVVTPSLYRPLQSNFFTLTDGEDRQDSPSVMRDPVQWQPTFTAWNALGAQFNDLKKALEGKYVTIKHGLDVGVVTPAVYDGLNSPAVIAAKMALLNLYVVLATQSDPVSGQPWFNFVNRVVRIDQERFVAIVDSDFYESVDHILNNLGRFAKDGFFRGDTALHGDNIPGEYQLTAPMISVKRVYEQGNLQLTMAKVRNAEGGCLLLDCDMDENSNLFLHTTDLFKHLFTGGTNPIPRVLHFSSLELSCCHSQSAPNNFT